VTGRERLEAVLRRQPADRLAWTAYVDRRTLEALPGKLRGASAIDFYDHIGCDIFLLNGYGASERLSSPAFEWASEVETRRQRHGDGHTSDWLTPWGALTAAYRRGHPIKYPVATLEDLRIYRRMWEGAGYRASDDRPVFERINAALGDRGIVTRFWGPSAIPRLLEQDVGVENFYYLLADHRGEMEELFALMHEREMEAFRALAAGPADVVILCENTSTHYISPEVYYKYNGPHVRDFVDAVHAAGKTAVIHMCGHVRNILDLIRETGLDGIHALTPPPTGDTPWELALDKLGEDLIVIGALEPTVIQLGSVADIGPALDRLLTPRLRRANLVLCAFGDGLPVPPERFRAVADWMERNGAA
jgi:hypothetical protein